MATIDIGPGAEDRAGWVDVGNTLIAKANPSNASGTIEYVSVWVNTNMGFDVSIGTFYGSSPLFTCRDWQAITVGEEFIPADGHAHTYPVDITVEVGDRLGIYWNYSGKIESSESGGEGFYYRGGNQMGAGQGFYNFFSGMDISIFGFTGWEHISKINGAVTANIAKINGVLVASIYKINGVLR
jgi:hypothetical protein